MEQKKLIEAKMLVLQACTLLRSYSGFTEAPPASLEEIQTCLLKLLPCLSILNSFDSVSTSLSSEKRARGILELKLRTGIYRILGVALARIVEYNGPSHSPRHATEEAPLEGHPTPSSGAEGNPCQARGPVSGPTTATPSGTTEEGGEVPPAHHSPPLCYSGADPPLAPASPPSAPQTTCAWTDICGCEEAILALRQATLLPRRFPGLFMGPRRAWRRVLLYGPPGTGKTLLANTTAQEVNAPLICISPADLLSRWVGESEKQVRAVFARAASRERCVLFFDEVDALGGIRGGVGETELARRLKTELLLQLQGLPPSVVLLAATNLPWEVDSAILRRFDRLIYVGLPPREVRRRVLFRQLDGIHHNLTFVEVEEVLDQTAGYSVSDTMHLLSQAMMGAVEDLVDADAYRLATHEDIEEYFSVKASQARGLNENKNISKHSKRQRPQRRAQSDACSPTSSYDCSLSTSTSPAAFSSSATESVIEGFTPLRSLAKPKTKSKPLHSKDFSIVVLPRSHPPRRVQAAAYGSVRLCKEASSAAPERHLKNPTLPPPPHGKNKYRKNDCKKTITTITNASETTGNCLMQSHGFDNREGDTPTAPAMYYIPCKSSHPNALPDLPSSFTIPPEFIILPPVRFTDILKAMKSFIPSVTAEDLKRFEAWRTRHDSSTLS
ncbi:unnamed protein product [Phytomonas sp. Hart1]|nr:unnamed protein product [Phytomonas sp. Hart1]|eukprot:CCW66460.1 unnamed protein product [Phytomonas sp. isolate Hart1]